MTRSRLLVLLPAMGLVAAACGGDDGASTTAPPGTTSAASSTTAPTTTVAPTTVAPTTVAPTTVVTSTTATSTTGSPNGEPFAVADPTLFPPTDLPGSGGAGGSGCTPGAGPLPDGIWYGFVDHTPADAVVIDLACFFFGDAAVDAAVEDGLSPDDVTNDYYVRNQSTQLRTVPMAPGALVYTLGEVTDDGFEQVTWDLWPVVPSYCAPTGAEIFCGVWLYVNGGLVTEVVEQYVP